MSIATQTRLRAHAGLPFDKLLSGETVKAYKPNAAVYQMAVSSLNIRPAEILMVAAHNYDLNAANGQGFRTTLIKIGAKVVSHGRYVVFQMAEVVIPRTLFADNLRLIAELRPPPVLSTA